jgi:hypothetical protein
MTTTHNVSAPNIYAFISSNQVTCTAQHNHFVFINIISNTNDLYIHHICLTVRKGFYFCCHSKTKNKFLGKHTYG